MKYTGHCHCNKVQFEVEIDFDSAKVITCNCSHCHQKGLVLTFVTPDKFKMISGDDDLTDYQFNTKRIHHVFCKHCGVQPFGRGTNSKGESMMAINVRCLDGVELEKLTLTPVNGKDY